MSHGCPEQVRLVQKMVSDSLTSKRITLALQRSDYLIIRHDDANFGWVVTTGRDGGWNVSISKSGQSPKDIVAEDLHTLSAIINK